jgi:two-component system C4-dicarboxylate transport sensor histidine kinase DctB
VRAATAPVWVSGDPQLLRVGVSNLINNALHAVSTRKQGDDPPFIELVVEAGPGVPRLLVADNGDGVPQALRPRLFEPFQSGKTSGVGIGLALSKRIAQAHGGDLELSGGHVGATFCLRLPRERT